MENRDIQDIKRDLKHVYWLGGSSCAGKSTIARLFADELGFELYAIDPKWFGDHLHAADPERHPGMVKYRESLGPTLPEIFNTVPVDDLVESQINFFIEEFEMIVDDLYELPKDRPILAEGTALLPPQVGQITDPNRAIWLVATESFERKIRQERIEKDSNERFIPAPWFDNLIAWSSKRRARTVSEAQELGLEVLETDGSRSIENTFEMIKLPSLLKKI